MDPQIISTITCLIFSLTGIEYLSKGFFGYGAAVLFVSALTLFLTWCPKKSRLFAPVFWPFFAFGIALSLCLLIDQDWIPASAAAAYSVFSIFAPQLRERLMKKRQHIRSSIHLE